MQKPKINQHAHQLPIRAVYLVHQQHNERLLFYTEVTYVCTYGRKGYA